MRTGGREYARHQRGHARSLHLRGLSARAKAAITGELLQQNHSALNNSGDGRWSSIYTTRRNGDQIQRFHVGPPADTFLNFSSPQTFVFCIPTVEINCKMYTKARAFLLTLVKRIEPLGIRSRWYSSDIPSLHGPFETSRGHHRRVKF